MVRNSEGFEILVRKNKTEPAKTEEPKEEKPHKEKKHKLPKFKKGSWKQILLKRLKHYKSFRNVEDFHFIKMENLLICFGKKKSAVSASSIRFNLKKLKEIEKKYPEAYIMINSGDCMYMKISISSYLKLMKIKRMAFNMSLWTEWDGDESYELYNREFVIDNINDLCAFINFHRQAIEGIYRLQCICCGFSTFDFSKTRWRTS